MACSMPVTGTKSIGRHAAIPLASPRSSSMADRVPAAPQAGDGIPEAERNGSLVEAYHRLLINPNPTIYEKAARDWCDWEMAIVAVHPNHKPHPRYERSDLRLCFARLVTHYWRHNAWLPDGIFLQQIDRLAGIPAVLIHGRLDIGSPLITTWQLAKSWPGSELIIVGGAGHDARDPGMSESIVGATDRFAAS